MMRLVAGTVVLDRYRVIAPPTAGAARGPLARAFDQRLGCHVDLVIAPQPLGTPLGDLFARRAHAVAVLQHPALPPLLDMGLHDSHVVLVYRHAPGYVLADMTAQEVRDWTHRRVLQLVADLAAALGLAHAHGLCHGSFSARSVLVERDGMVTILDLAWPRPGTAVERADVAPEVQRGHAPTPRADVFALGQVLRRLTHTIGPEAGRGLDVAIQDVVRRATARAPHERYADGAALAQAMGNLLAGSPSTQASIYAPHPRVPRQRPQVAAVSASRHPVPVGRGAQGPLRGALLPIALSLAIGLLPVAGAVVHGVVGHMPFVGLHLQRDDDEWRGGWPSWGQDPTRHQWRDGRPDQSWTWGLGPDDSSP